VYIRISVKSDWASGESSTVLLWADIGIGGFAPAQAGFGILAHFGNQLGSEWYPFSSVELVDPRLEFGSKRIEFALLKKPQGIEHDGVGVGILAAINPALNAVSNFGGKCHAQLRTSCRLA
jgi:hypothetical protein